MAYVYRHIRLDKNEPFYIGIGSDKNYARAYTKNNRNNYWKNIIIKTNYEIDILFDSLSWEDACLKEKEFILIYGRKDLKTGILVNLTNGGDGKVGNIVSKETREKLSKARIGKKLSKEHKAKLIESNKNRVFSQETLKKMSESHKGIRFFGNKPSEKTKRKISEFHKNRKRQPLSEETKRKIGDTNRLKKHLPISEEAKKKQSESMKIYWAKRKEV